MTVSEKRRLGRGLDALLGSGSTPAKKGAAATEEVSEVALDQIEHNPYQPRKDFDAEELKALKNSLKNVGLLQPIVVRQTDKGFQLIAGERRLRAAKDAGWKQVPVKVVDFNDRQVFEAALIENVQRADLNPIEKALGFQEYIDRYQVTQEELAKRMGLDRSTVSNIVRLLELPPKVQDAVRVGQISNGHARALLSIRDNSERESLCKEIIAKGLSVRAVEALTKGQKPESSPTNGKIAGSKTAHIQSIEEELKQRFMTKVEVRLKADNQGQFVIDFDSNDNFERILGLLRCEPEAGQTAP